MRYFKEKEFVCRCCGELPPFARANIEALVREVLDPLREAYGKPIYVTSGYRCEKHNKEVGGVNGSQHTKGEACNIHAGPSTSSGLVVEENLKLAKLVVKNGKFDQLIIYPVKSGSMLPQFLHVSWKRSGGPSTGPSTGSGTGSGTGLGTNRQRILMRVKGCGSTATYRTVRREEVLS